MRKGRAFTLIELLVVITIIGILMMLVAVTLQPVQRRSRDSKRKADVNLLLAGLNQFHVDYKVYPNYTYILGTTNNAGERESFFNLGADLAMCTNFGETSPGYPRNFVQAASDDVGLGAQINSPSLFDSETDYNSLVMRPGFRSVNHFLVCLKYIDRLIVDPRPSNNHEDYQYQVSYDYQNVLVSAKMENQNDVGATDKLFPGVTASLTLQPGRYFEGNGRFVWQFDEITDGVVSANGRYFYQCRSNNASPPTVISRDERTLTKFQPFVTSLTTLNPNCLQSGGVTNREHVPTN